MSAGGSVSACLVALLVGSVSGIGDAVTLPPVKSHNQWLIMRDNQDHCG